RLARRLLERLERAGRTAGTRRHDCVIRLGDATIIARGEEIIITSAPKHPRTFDQHREGILHRVWRDQILRSASGRERHSVGAKFLYLDRLYPGTPVEQPLACRGVVEGHRVDLDEALTAQQRMTHVGEGA